MEGGVSICYAHIKMEDRVRSKLMKSKLSAICGLAALVVGTHSAAVNATVIASWSDNGSNSFSFVDNGINPDGIGDLSASSTGLTTLFLPVLNYTFTNASYTLTDTSSGALTTTSQVASGSLINATFEAGILTIKTNIAENSFGANTTLLTATFDSATGVFGSFFTLDTLDNVVFSGPALGNNTATAEQFSFSAANVIPVNSVIVPPDMEDWTATTSFTSSATLTPVPVPPAVFLFGSGLVGLISIARKKAA